MKNKVYGVVAVLVFLCGIGAAMLLAKKEPAKLEAADHAALTFTTTMDYPIDDSSIDGTTTQEVLVTKEAIETVSLPMFKENAEKSFVGWKLESINYAETTKNPNSLVEGKVYKPYELLRQGFYAGDTAAFSAVYAPQGSEGTTDIYENQTGGTGSVRTAEDRTPSLSSISGLSAYLSQANIFVYPNPDSSSSDLAKTYALSSDGFKAALYDLSKVDVAQKDEDFYLFLGGSVTGLSSSVGAKTTDPANASEASFYALKDKIGSLTITGRLTSSSYTDPVTDTILTATPAATTAARFAFGSQTGVNFGTNVELRNIYYLNISSMAANGNSLYLGGSTYGSVTCNVYGGSSDGSDVEGQEAARMTISSTGAGTSNWNIYGGSNGGTYTGNTDVFIKGTSNTLASLQGGSTNSGKIIGNTQVTVEKSTGTISSLYGGSDNGTVTGSTDVAVNQAVAITSLYGGTNTGSVGGGTNVVINSSAAIGDLSAGARGAGTITGDTRLILNGGSGVITNIYGGTNGGTVNGNTQLIINKRGSTITNLYGGTNTGTINGNVYNKLFAISSANRFTVGTIFRGGAASGTINGSIENFIAGYGNISTAFYGGSTTGNIGVEGQNDSINTIYDSSLFTSGNNVYVGSNVTRGHIRASVINTVRSGKTASTGSIGSFSGAAGESATELAITAAGINGFTEADSTGRQAYAYSAAKNSSTGAALTVIVIGNIDSHLLGGIMSSGAYTYGTGRRGYFEGDAVLTVGILNGDDTRAGGYNYCTSAAGATNVGNNLEYKVSTSAGSSSTLRTYTQNNWDIHGGGDVSYGYYVKGNTSLIQNNVLARWTYGGGNYGCIEGNTSNTLNGGLVDTLEGGGFATNRIWGNTTARMNNGEVNFFFSGGGWNDERIYGNAKAYCTGGIINSAIGGTYGSTAAHTIYGDADVYVTGGDFSGYPSHGVRGFSGGGTYLGRITGNSSLTLDLRNSTGFKLPSGISITGGRNYNAGAGTYLGTDENNTITLNIYTAPGNDVLNGATIYGDGGTTAYAGNTRSGKIIMNIDAPGSSIGNLYATQYNNISSSTLRRDVKINVLRAKSIGGLSGGNASDNITNTVAANSKTAGRGVAVELGTILAPNAETGYEASLEDVNKQAEKEIAEDASATPKNICFSGVGLVNFTSLSIKNEFVALASGGNIKNGLSATAANHWTTYDKFGEVTVETGSGFGVTTANNLISAGKMTIEGEGGIYSLAGTGVINLSSIVMDSDTSRLTWFKQPGGANNVASQGTHFGNGNAFQVLTFSSSNAAGNAAVTGQALEITPFNFKGVETSTGKTFVGDNDVKTGASSTPANQKEFGIMIPGSVIDYTVIADESFDEDLGEMVQLSNGKGNIMHDVTEVFADNVDPSGDSIKAWGTETAGTRVQTGRLIIPILSDNQIIPTLTFTPDAKTASWIRNITVDSTDLTSNSPFDWKLEEQKDSKPQTWTFNQGMKDASAAEKIGNEYSYKITVVYSNQAEISGSHVIISSNEAQELKAKSEINDLQNVFGRPYLTSDLSEADWQAIKDGLPKGSESPERYRINYTATDADMVSDDAVANTKTEAYNLIIVPNESVISAKKDLALYAHDASFLLYEAKNLSGQPELDERTGAVAFYASDGDGSADSTADLAESYLTAIQNQNSADVIPITYTITSPAGETLKKEVAIEITGALTLSKVPDSFDFGTQTTMMKEQTHWADLTAGSSPDRGWTEIVVTDTRGDGVAWTLSVKESSPLKDPETNLSLAGCLYYQDTASSVEQVLSGAAYNVLMNETNGSVLGADYVENYTITEDWQAESKGIKLKVPKNKQIVGSYSGELEWTLTFEP